MLAVGYKCTDSCTFKLGYNAFGLCSSTRHDWAWANLNTAATTSGSLRAKAPVMHFAFAGFDFSL
jgi:hypothetical protein